MQAFNAQSSEELIQLAKKNTQQGNFSQAIRQYNALLNWYPEQKLEPKLLVIIAGLYYEAGEPKAALVTLEEYGEKYPDSHEITKLVQLAGELGKQYILGKLFNYQVLNRYSKALRAFEFVTTHDPFGQEAAQAMLSSSIIYMRRKEWDQAIFTLKDIGRKQPATPIAAEAEIYLGECYLRGSKGAVYDSGYLENARRYLEGYLSQYPKGKDRKKAEVLLEETFQRQGRKELQAARLYLTSRKWDAAKLYLDDILAEPLLHSAHPEARELLSFVATKSK